MFMGMEEGIRLDEARDASRSAGGNKALPPLRCGEIAGWLATALAAQFFTNIEAVPAAIVVVMLCCCFLAERLERLCSFFLCLVLVGLAMGVSCWGYLSFVSPAVTVIIQLVLGLAYVAHRRLTQRHPDVWSTSLAFPCVSTAIWVLAMLFLPIGSVGSPVYSVADCTILCQMAALLGRSSVTFLLCWIASSAAHYAATKHLRGLQVSLGVLCLVYILGALRFYASTFFLDMQEGPLPGGPDRQFHHVSCLTNAVDIEANTRERLDAGDTLILHAERATGQAFSWTGLVLRDSQFDGIDYVERYEKMLKDRFNATGNTTEAAIVLSLTERDDRSWYHLVTRHGAQMSYAKNHPVPFIESDILAGDAPPTVTSLVLGGTNSAPVQTTGTICFDTDFPAVTRRLAEAELLLETSATWANIGRVHLKGHRLTAIENGQTLVKCTLWGQTGAIDPYGSLVYSAPTSEGVTSFSVPRYPKLAVFPELYIVFDAAVGVLAVLWLALAASPSISTKVLSGPLCRCCG